MLWVLCQSLNLPIRFAALLHLHVLIQTYSVGESTLKATCAFLDACITASRRPPKPTCTCTCKSQYGCDFGPRRPGDKAHKCLGTHTCTCITPQQCIPIRPNISITSTSFRQMVDADIIMSPARRSVRLAGRKRSMSRSEDYILSSLTEMPDDVNFGYLPNPLL